MSAVVLDSGVKPGMWPVEPGLVALEWERLRQHLRYEFNLWEGSGTPRETAQNLTVSKNGSPTWEHNKFGLGYKFDNIASDLTVTGDNEAELSFECLLILRQASEDAYVAMVESPGSGTADRALYNTAGGKFGFEIFDGAAKEILSDAGVASVNTAYHLIGTADGTNIELFINGASVGTTAAGNPFVFATPELTLGSGAVPGTGPDRSGAEIIMFRGWDFAIRAPLAAQLARDPFGPFRMVDDLENHLSILQVLGIVPINIDMGISDVLDFNMNLLDAAAFNIAGSDA